MNKVKVCSSAMVLIGENPINSFEDGSTEAEVARQLFDTTYEALLTETRWRFATSTKKLNRLIDTPDNEYMKYAEAFSIPSDVLIIHSCTSNPYEIYGTVLNTDNKEATIAYTYRPDLALVPAYFVKALEYRLAQEFAIPITGDEGKVQLFASLANQQVIKARHVDAASRTNTSMGPGSYTAVRY